MYGLITIKIIELIVKQKALLFSPKIGRKSHGVTDMLVNWAGPLMSFLRDSAPVTSTVGCVRPNCTEMFGLAGGALPDGSIGFFFSEALELILRLASFCLPL